MHHTFPLFSTPIDLAHMYWNSLLEKGDTVIDATAGNGKDTLTLCRILDRLGGGKVVAIDIQEKAIEHTSQRICHYLPHFIDQIQLYHRSHETFPDHIPSSSVKLVVYNLGYLPGGDKSFTTITKSTLQSINHSLDLLKRGGCLSITCYPGHREGEYEYESILSMTADLCKETYCICVHTFSNRHKSPVLFLIQKSR